MAQVRRLKIDWNRKTLENSVVGEKSTEVELKV
jgi:hypothetical protein